MQKIIAIDFDGTLCENQWPNIGAAKLDVIRKAKAEKQQGAKLILWTCRTGAMLEQAVAWCRDMGLTFDAINDNLPETQAAFDSNPRKVSATEYWDDRAVSYNIPSCNNCTAYKHTSSKKHHVYPGCANSCKNFRPKE